MTMILSSADILRILGGSEIVRLSARLSIVDGKPKLSGAEGLFIYIERFPRVDEFEATWSIYIESDGSEPDDIVIEELKRLLPSVKIKEGLLLEATTTDFRSESTQVAPVAPVPVQANSVPGDYEERFQSLLEDVQDQMLLIKGGRDGKDGASGADGVDGRDGKDLIATDAELFDLKDVEQGIQMERGQVLTWDGSKWTNLYVRQTTSIGGGGGGGTGGGGIEEAPTDGRRYVRESAAWSVLTPSDSGQGGIEEAPLDGNYYVRSSGKWLDMVGVLDSLGYTRSDILDGGDFTNVTTDATDDAVIDGGNFQ